MLDDNIIYYSYKADLYVFFPETEGNFAVTVVYFLCCVINSFTNDVQTCIQLSNGHTSIVQ